MVNVDFEAYVCIPRKIRAINEAFQKLIAKIIDIAHTRPPVRPIGIVSVGMYSNMSEAMVFVVR